MKRYWVIILCLLALLLFGCGQKAEEIAGKTTTPYYGKEIFLPHPEAEQLMTDAFTMLEWEDDDWARVVRSRAAIDLMFEFMDIQLDVEGRIKYYNLRVGYDFVSWLWREKLAPELDKRSLEGDLGGSVSMNYYYVRRDISNNLRNVNVQLGQVEKQIADDAKQADIDMIIELYDTIKPLVDFIK